MAETSCQPACQTCHQLRAAALAVIGDGGLDALTDERLAEASRIPAEHVCLHYPTARACLHDTYEEVSRSVLADFEAAFAAERGWRRALTLVGRNLLARMAERPAEARLCFVEILRGDHELLRRRDASRQRMVDLFVHELGVRRGRDDLPEMQIELLIGAAFQAIAAAVNEDRIAELPELEPELTSRARVFEPDFV